LARDRGNVHAAGAARKHRYERRKQRASRHAANSPRDRIAGAAKAGVFRKSANGVAADGAGYLLKDESDERARHGVPPHFRQNAANAPPRPQNRAAASRRTR
jgi:hypothetical protein